jgi:hypothetical protein
VVTESLAAQLATADARLVRRERLRDADAADRIAQVLARQILRALEGVPQDERVAVGVEVARLLAQTLQDRLPRSQAVVDQIAMPGEILTADLRRGSARRLFSAFTTADGEPPWPEMRGAASQVAGCRVFLGASQDAELVALPIGRGGPAGERSDAPGWRFGRFSPFLSKQAMMGGNEL